MSTLGLEPMALPGPAAEPARNGLPRTWSGARAFATASGVLARSDRVDARVLAEVSARLDLPDTRPPDPARQFMAGQL